MIEKYITAKAPSFSSPLNESEVTGKTEDLAFLSRSGCVVVMLMTGSELVRQRLERKLAACWSRCKSVEFWISGEVRVVGPLVAEPVGSAHEEVDEVVEVGVGVGEGPGQPGGRARARARQRQLGRPGGRS